MTANDLKIWLATVPDEAEIEFRGVTHTQWFAEADVRITIRWSPLKREEEPR